MASTESQPKRAPGRPRGAKPVAAAGDFLEAAEQLLLDDGPEVLTLAKVAERVGVSKPILYRHVGDKDALTKALAERLVDRISVSIEKATSDASSAQDAVGLMVSAYLKAIERDRNIYLYVTAGGVGADPVGESLQLADRAVGPMEAGFAQLRESLGADPAVARAWAYATVGMLHFVALSWLRDPSADLDTLATHTAQLLWSGLGGTDPSATT